MRGKECSSSGKSTGDGITPAYAGKSVKPVPGRRIRRDHPRLCGEKLNGKYSEVDVSGSPPPMRGKD